MRWLAHLYLRIRGWQFVGSPPADPKFVAVGAPHTSNWDFVVFLGVIHHFRIAARYLGKHTLFRRPFGGLMRRLGGIPVDRAQPGNLARDVAAECAAADRFALVMAPEGTRSATPMWKSGFYRIALAARVPVVPAYIDLPNRRAGIGEPIWMTGDAAVDMDRIRAFYDTSLDVPPPGLGPIRIREEDDA